MDPENADMKTEYSPLNNMSSSGEDVEQFTLPVTPVSHERPKRRRKRKEFDAMAPHAKFINSFKRGRVCPTCAGFVTAALFILLIACVCGLSVVIYYMSNNVAKMQKLIDNLQVAKGTTFSSLLTLEGKLDRVENKLQQLEILSENLTSNINDCNESILSLKLDIKSAIAIKATKTPSTPSESGVESQKQLAKFGSDILALKDDVAGLQQRQLSFQDRLDDMDKMQSSSSYSKAERGSTNTPPLKSNQLIELQASILSVNDSCSSSVSTMKILVQNISGNVDLYKVSSGKKIRKLSVEIAALQNDTKDIPRLNETVDMLISRIAHIESICNQSDSETRSDKTDAEIVNRVDELERYVRELRGQLTSQLTRRLENEMVNLTIASGIEDIVTRAMNLKVVPVQSSVTKNAAEIDELRSLIMALEKNVSSVYHAEGLTVTSDETSISDSLNSTNKPSNFSFSSTTQPLTGIGDHPSNDEIDPRSSEQVDPELDEQVGSKPVEQVRPELDEQVGSKPVEQVRPELDEQVGSKPVEQVRPELDEQVGSKPVEQVRPELDEQVDSKPDEQVRPESGGIKSPAHGELEPQSRDQVTISTADLKLMLGDAEKSTNWSPAPSHMAAGSTQPDLIR